jgi:hypothetical protein
MGGAVWTFSVILIKTVSGMTVLPLWYINIWKDNRKNFIIFHTNPVACYASLGTITTSYLAFQLWFYQGWVGIWLQLEYQQVKQLSFSQPSLWTLWSTLAQFEVHLCQWKCDLVLASCQLMKLQLQEEHTFWWVTGIWCQLVWLDKKSWGSWWIDIGGSFGQFPQYSFHWVHFSHDAVIESAKVDDSFLDNDIFDHKDLIDDVPVRQ